MKILMLTIDASAYNDGSQFHDRLKEYGKLFEELHVIVFTSMEKKKISISSNIFLYSLGSRKILLPLAAYRLGSALIRSELGNWIITAQEEFTGVVGFFLSQRFRIPWRAELHTDIFSPYFTQLGLKNKMKKMIARFLLPRASCIRVVSERIKKSLGVRCIQPVSVLPVYFECEKFFQIASERSYENTEETTTYLMISRLTREKNITCALDAVAKLKGAILVVVGDGPERYMLEKYAKKLGVEGRVRFEGEQNDIGPYLRAAHIFLSTSWYEGYGIAPLEAALSGLPVIMTDVGVAGDLIINGISGYIIRPGDTDALFVAMDTLHRNAVLRERLGRNGTKIREHISSKERYLLQFKQSCEACLK